MTHLTPEGREALIDKLARRLQYRAAMHTVPDGGEPAPYDFLHPQIRQGFRDLAEEAMDVFASHAPVLRVSPETSHSVAVGRVVMAEGPSLARRMLADIAQLVDNDLPGLTVGIGRHDGDWVVQQHYTGLEESYPTDVCAAAETLPGALAAAVGYKAARS